MDFNVHWKYQGGLLTHATKTHASGLHMKFSMTLQVEKSSEITRFPSDIRNNQVMSNKFIDLYLKPNRFFAFAIS